MRQTGRLVLVLDGQGGGMGAQLVKLLAGRLPDRHCDRAAPRDGGLCHLSSLLHTGGQAL